MKNNKFYKIDMEIPFEVKYAVTRLSSKGYRAYPVGGCVRDCLLGKEPSDWDITTDAKPREIIQALEGNLVIETGIKHGTVTLVKNNKMVEITTFRFDGEYKDFRHPDKVYFTNEIVEDLQRRDFTVNAMAIDLSREELIDPFDGEEDLAKKVIRCVGTPEKRFSEDALRILRGLRFASVYNFEIEKRTSEALVNLRNNLRNIAVERIKVEMDKLLLGDGAAEILREYTDVFQVFMPEIKPMVGFEQKNIHHIYDVWEHTLIVIENSPKDGILRWAALFHDMGKPNSYFFGDDGQGHFYGHGKESARIANEIMLRLRFDNESRKSINELVLHHDEVLTPTKKSIRRRLNRMGEENFRRLIALAKADNLGQNPKYRDRFKNLMSVEKLLDDIIEGQECFSLKDMNVNGKDMISLGYRGKEIGKILDNLLNQVIEEKIENNREELLKEAAKRKKNEKTID